MPTQSANKASLEAKKTRTGQGKGPDQAMVNGSGHNPAENKNPPLIASDALKRLEKKVVKYPLDSISVAFMAGVVFSLILTRK